MDKTRGKEKISCKVCKELSEVYKIVNCGVCGSNVCFGCSSKCNCCNSFACYSCVPKNNYVKTY